MSVFKVRLFSTAEQGSSGRTVMTFPYDYVHLSPSWQYLLCTHDCRSVSHCLAYIMFYILQKKNAVYVFHNDNMPLVTLGSAEDAVVCYVEVLHS